MTVSLKPIAPIYDHGLLQGLTDDDHSQYALLLGRAAGQTLHGGTGASDPLVLRGSSNAARGVLEAESRIDINVPVVGAAYADSKIRWASTYNATGVITIDTFIDYSPTIDIQSIGYIPTGFHVGAAFTQSVAPNAIFSGFILFDADPSVDISAGFQGLRSSIYQDRMSYLNDGGGAAMADVVRHEGVAFLPLLRARTSGDRMGVAELAGLYVQPNWDTVAGATVDFGQTCGVRMLQPVQWSAGASAGTENIEFYHGLHMDAITMVPDTGEVAGLYSDMTAAATRYFVRNPGGAQSEDSGIFSWVSGGRPRVPQDGVGIIFGASDDVEVSWNASNFLRFDPLTGTSLDFYFNQTNHILLVPSSTSVGMRVAGARVGIGNHVPTATTTEFYGCATPSISAPAAGAFQMARFYTSGAITVTNLAMTRMSTVTIEGASINLGVPAGTIDDLSTLHLRGQVGTAATRKHHLWVDEGRSRVDGHLNLGSANIAQLTGNTDNLAIPVTSGARTVLRIDADAARNLTGIVREQDADVITLVNHGAFTITLVHDATSTAANRFFLPGAANFALTQHEAIMLWYDTTDNRWRKLA